ncbi:6-bladed beta-propeller [Halosquirtibacter xylanolyticus]|uniref:6-bladed beta-propeller n=1 Tax=Halosquirtibacter xylanolyticus TaxID=3374599 RepID=UPI0037498D85|nr:6-bladed beta-propeller [Prolixibacteraceae bacterium]
MRKIVLLMSVLLVGCSSKVNFGGFAPQDLKLSDVEVLKLSTDSLVTIHVPEKSNEETIDASSIVDSVYAIPLETNKECLIGAVSDIRIHNDLIYVIDKRVSDAIFVFDMKGRFLNRIGKKGRGPGEYTKLSEVQVDKCNNEILISSPPLQKLLRYNPKGEFLGYIDINVAYLEFSILNDGNIVLYAWNQKNKHLGELENRLFYIVNREGAILKAGPMFKPIYPKVHMRTENGCMSSLNQVSYSPILSDTINSISSNSVKAQYALDFGKNSIHGKVPISCSTYQFGQKVRKNHLSYFLGSHLETNSYLCFTCESDGKLIHMLYHKKSASLINCNRIQGDERHMFFFPFNYYSHDRFISAISPKAILEIGQQFKKADEAIFQCFMKIFHRYGVRELSADNNPIIVFTKLKDDFFDTNHK